jgi:transcriptional regulator with XRE-family HTH domain/membrane protein implicated in regulation of membrane protease activity/cell division protein FtsB
MNNKFSENLKKIRKDNNISQEQLADELGVSRQAISKWESAVAYPEMDKIITLCEKFNLNIDDLLHKDIREVNGEEESKKKLNRYVDDFLNFITNTINMFSNMSLKSKCKCLFEQVIIALILYVICLILGILGRELFSGIFGVIPDRLYYILHSILYLAFGVFATMSSVVIMVHIFKTRYLDYYEKRKKVDIEEQIGGDKKLEELDKEEKNDKKNKSILKQNEDKIIIRDPIHSEYKFINGLFKGIVGIIKFFILCFATILFVTLICLFVVFILSFLVIPIWILFIGLIITILSGAIINIVLILLLLNFVFNRKNDKKKMIWSFVISLITFGIGCGLILVSTLNFEYIENDKELLKTEYIELDMKSDLTFGYHYPAIEYIESDNNNIKIEYTVNKYCNINQPDVSDSVIHIWASCDNPLKLVKEVVKNFRNKKIMVINNQLYNIRIYTTKENIRILKKNYKEYIDVEAQIQNMINSYEKMISGLHQKIDDYVQREWEHEEEINDLKDQLNICKNLDQ